MKKYIIALCLICTSMAHSQTNVVGFDGANLWSKGGGAGATAIIAAGITNYFRPAFGSLYDAESPFHLASSIVVSNGTVSAGSVTNTWVRDQSYFGVQETGVFEIYYNITNSITRPTAINMTAYYDGNPSHDVLIQAKDWTTGTYSNIGNGVDDWPSGKPPTTKTFYFPAPRTNFVSAGRVTIRAIHVGSAVGSHYFYTDYLDLINASITLTNAGTYYKMVGYTSQASNNVTVLPASGEMVTVDAGWYRTSWQMAFIGSSNTTFHIQHRTNNVASGIDMWRTIGNLTQIGSAGAQGYKHNKAGVTNSWWIQADSSNAWISIISGEAATLKVGN